MCYGKQVEEARGFIASKIEENKALHQEWVGKMLSTRCLNRYEQILSSVRALVKIGVSEVHAGNVYIINV